MSMEWMGRMSNVTNGLAERCGGAAQENLFSGIQRGLQTAIRPRSCLHCGKLFTPRRRKETGVNRNTYCCRGCAAHAPKQPRHFHTPPSTKAERVRANGLVNKRLKLGHFAKPTHCMRCGAAKPLDSHHPDYQRPDLVAFLCRSCHVLCHNRPAISRHVAALAVRAERGTR
jgi:hypothetical protein